MNEFMNRGYLAREGGPVLNGGIGGGLRGVLGSVSGVVESRL